MLVLCVLYLMSCYKHIPWQKMSNTVKKQYDVCQVEPVMGRSNSRLLTNSLHMQYLTLYQQLPTSVAIDTYKEWNGIHFKAEHIINAIDANCMSEPVETIYGCSTNLSLGGGDTGTGGCGLTPWWRRCCLSSFPLLCILEGQRMT